jgi:RHS repeat-associated protein
VDSPYLLLWDAVAAGSYTLTVKAIDNLGGQATSSPIAVTVVANQAPSTDLSATSSSATAPAMITLQATASDTDGSIAKVEFFAGPSKLATMTQAPYVFSWHAVPAGTYILTARATDNAGASTTSTAVTITIAEQAAGNKVYFIETDHLNTPRRISDPANQVVWQWQNNDPFGNNVPVSAAGFEFNLRFPGQYFDRETNLHYNYFRDYDPSTGRYIQSDPIGLDGGLNTYLYGDANPISKVDPLGLFGCPGGTRQEYRGPGNVVCVPDQNAPSPAVCGTAECAAGILPVQKAFPTACERECGIGSDNSLEGALVCKLVSEGGKLLGIPGIPVTLACKAVNKRACVKKCEERNSCR